MPVYVYEVIMPDDTPGEVLEVIQRMSDPPLEIHPETGQPIRRVLTAPKVTGKWSDQKMGNNLSDKNLEAKGFTKYVKSGDGRYEKAVGKGPDLLSAD
jgi:predicted nucleic acid-binding Zn ribbon protein